MKKYVVTAVAIAGATAGVLAWRRRQNADEVEQRADAWADQFGAVAQGTAASVGAAWQQAAKVADDAARSVSDASYGLADSVTAATPAADALTQTAASAASSVAQAADAGGAVAKQVADRVGEAADEAAEAASRAAHAAAETNAAEGAAEGEPARPTPADLRPKTTNSAAAKTAAKPAAKTAAKPTDSADPTKRARQRTHGGRTDVDEESSS